MKRAIIVMSPTATRAVYEWKAFLSRWSTIVKKANRASLYIELLSGQKIYFKCETEEQRAVLRGLHADIVSEDEFEMQQEREEEIKNMTKVVCDLCGKDINTSVLLRPIGNFRVSLVQYGDALDLCEDCKMALDKWISERKAESEEES